MIIRLARAWRACLFAAVACLGTSAQAANDEPRGSLTLARALEAALTNNPELAASRYELTAAQGRLIQAGKRPNPELSLEFENIGVGVETTLALSQVIELGDKRALRRSIAESDSDSVTIDLRARQLDLLADVTARYIGVVAAQERARFAEQNAALARQTLEAISARVKAARSPLAEESRAKIALTRADIERRQSVLTLDTARSALAMTWGRVDARFDSASADLFAFAPIESFESLAARLANNPDLRRFASEARLRDAELALARAQTRPNVALSVGVRRFQQTGDNALVAGFSMPIAFNDRNQGNILEARSRRAQLDAERIASETRLRGLLYALYREATAARDRAVALRDEALPQAREALKQTQGGYERGRFSFLELLTTQQDVLELGEAAIDAAADYHRLLADIERLTSEPLTTPISEALLP